jgi:hypothetical protein
MYDSIGFGRTTAGAKNGETTKTPKRRVIISLQPAMRQLRELESTYVFFLSLALHSQLAHQRGISIVASQKTRCSTAARAST